MAQQTTMTNGYYVSGDWVIIPHSRWVNDESLKGQLRPLVGDLLNTLTGNECLFLYKEGKEAVYLFKYYFNVSQIRVLSTKSVEIAPHVDFILSFVKTNLIPTPPTTKVSSHLYLQVFSYVPCSIVTNPQSYLTDFVQRGVVDEDLFGNKLSCSHYEFYQMLKPAATTSQVFQSTPAPVSIPQPVTAPTQAVPSPQSQTFQNTTGFSTGSQFGVFGTSTSGFPTSSQGYSSIYSGVGTGQFGTFGQTLSTSSVTQQSPASSSTNPLSQSQESKPSTTTSTTAGPSSSTSSIFPVLPQGTSPFSLSSQQTGKSSVPTWGFNNGK